MSHVRITSEASCQHGAKNRLMLACKELAASPSGLSGLINKSLLEAFSPRVSVMWYELMHMVLDATLWPSLAPHPAERAFQDGLLHFNWYQAGHQAGQCVIDDRREGCLVGRQREIQELGHKIHKFLKSLLKCCSDKIPWTLPWAAPS